MLPRHSLVWLSQEGWMRAMAELPEDCRQDADAWRRHDWPAVVRRPDDNTSPNASAEIALGLSPAPARNPAENHVGCRRRRIALVASTEDIARTAMPLLLSDAMASAPDRWRSALVDLADAGESAGVTLRIFGSLAWQHLTGAICMTARSDIDLLLYPDSMRQLEDGLELLSEHAAQLPLDGEIVFPNGDAVAWKEWRQARVSSAGCRVLVKHLHGVRLVPVAGLLTLLSRSEKIMPC